MAMTSDWRLRARAHIESLIAAHQPADAKAFRALARRNYPFMQRTGWAYKVWLDEVNKTALTIGEVSAVPSVRYFWVSEEAWRQKRG